MDVIDCPKCGSDDIESKTASFNYGGYNSWKCNACGWYYKKGNGIGTGTSNEGVRPQRAGPAAGQATLSEVGEYCQTCDTVVAGEHGCRADYHVEEGEIVPQEDVIDALEKWHYKGGTQLKKDIEQNRVHLTPTFYYVTLPGDTSEIDEQLVEAVRICTERDTDGWYPDLANIGEIADEMCAENGIEKAFIERRLNSLNREGRLKRRKFGYEWRTSE